MRNSHANNRRSSASIHNNRLGGLLIVVIALILLFIFVIQGYSLRNRLEYYDARLDEKKREYEEEQSRTEEIEDIQKYMQTDEYIEAVARERLGLVKENEVVFKEVE